MPQMPSHILDAIAALVRPYRPGLDADGLRALLSADPPASIMPCSAAAPYLGISVRTVQRRVAASGIQPKRIATGRYGTPVPCYSLDDLRRACGAATHSNNNPTDNHD